MAAFFARFCMRFLSSFFETISPVSSSKLQLDRLSCSGVRHHVVYPIGKIGMELSICPGSLMKGIDVLKLGISTSRSGDHAPWEREGGMGIGRGISHRRWEDQMATNGLISLLGISQKCAVGRAASYFGMSKALDPGFWVVPSIGLPYSVSVAAVVVLGGSGAGYS